MCLGLHETHFNWATGQTWKKMSAWIQRPGVGAGSRWPGCQKGGGGINRWKPGWLVDICERAFSKNWDTVFKRGARGKETRHYSSPGENTVTRGLYMNALSRSTYVVVIRGEEGKWALLRIGRWKPGWPVDGYWRAFAKGGSFVRKLLQCENAYLEAGSADCGKLGCCRRRFRESSWLLLLGFYQTDFERSRCNHNNNKDGTHTGTIIIIKIYWRNIAKFKTLKNEPILDGGLQSPEVSEWASENE